MKKVLTITLVSGKVLRQDHDSEQEATTAFRELNAELSDHQNENPILVRNGTSFLRNQYAYAQIKETSAQPLLTMKAVPWLLGFSPVSILTILAVIYVVAAITRTDVVTFIFANNRLIVWIVSVTVIIAVVALLLGVAIWSYHFVRDSSSRLAHSIRVLPLRAIATIFAIVTVALILAPIVGRAIDDNVNTGKSHILLVNNYIADGIHPSPGFPARNMAIYAADSLYPGSTTVFGVVVSGEKSRFTQSAPFDCNLQQSSGVGFLLSQESSSIAGYPQYVCNWALTTATEGSEVLKYSILIKSKPARKFDGVHVIDVRQNPINLGNISTATGIATGALTIVLLLAGKKS